MKRTLLRSIFVLSFFQLPLAHAEGDFLGNFLSQAFESAGQAIQKAQVELQKSAPRNESQRIEAGEFSGGYYGNSSGFQVSSTRTSDSSIELRGPMPSRAKELMLRISYSDESSHYYEGIIKPERGEIFTRVYLNRGAGEYTVKLYQCLDGEEYCSGFERFQITNTDSRDLSFLLPSANIQSDDPGIQSLARSITAGLKTDYEKSRAIHRWLTTNIAYDTQAYFSNQYSKMPSDALVILERKMAVCRGYSNLNAALHRAVGIRAKVVFGQAAPVYTGESKATGTVSAGDHAWNEILIQGKWLSQDATWDAGFVDFGAQKFSFSPHEKYFFPSEDEFKKTHQKLEERRE